jgi:hypothetical protein
LRGCAGRSAYRRRCDRHRPHVGGGRGRLLGRGKHRVQANLAARGRGQYGGARGVGAVCLRCRR